MAMRDGVAPGELNIAALQRQYRSGTLTPDELLDQLRGRIRADASFNAWIHVLTDAQLAPYLAALARPEAGALPLYGIPFAIKDNIDLAGVPTTAACPAFAYTPSQSAMAVQRLIDAGAIPLGKTNLDQFATGLVGVRSPYGATRNAVLPEYIAGGSSAGSAVAVRRGHVCFALGTDTAGSGRVPAAFNGVVGWKPSPGLVSTAGVVPACPSLDCVSVFSASVTDARTVAAVLGAFDAKDPWSRRYPVSAGSEAIAVLGVPAADHRPFFGGAYDPSLYEAAIAHARQLGMKVMEVDIAPFIAAGKLLYGGPWAAERRLSVMHELAVRPADIERVIREILEPAATLTAVDAFAGMHKLAQLRRAAEAVLASVDALLLPTVGGCFTIDAVLADPIVLNTQLGHYTTFANLLDLAAVALPAGHNAQGLPFGVSVLQRAGSDERLLSFGARWCGEAEGAVTAVPAPGWLDLVVCGAHMQGLPLNGQLTTRGGVFVRAMHTAPRYRFYALPGTPARPGLVRVTDAGAAVAVEVWRLPATAFGELLGAIPAPLCLGTVALADGTSATGFLCEAVAAQDARDITAFGGWRAFIASLS